MNKSLAPSYQENPQAEEIVRKAVEACLEAKGELIRVLDVSRVFDLADYFLIVSGRSDRQVQGISNRIAATLEEYGRKPESIEGYDEGHWILMDFGELIVHVFYESTRTLYDLDGLWVKAKEITPDVLPAEVGKTL